MFFFPRLRFHLLNFDRVRFPSPHVELVVAHA
jgi:hypothetical protein